MKFYRVEYTDKGTRTYWQGYAHSRQAVSEAFRRYSLVRITEPLGMWRKMAEWTRANGLAA